jgi:hypothetical protein
MPGHVHHLGLLVSTPSNPSTSCSIQEGSVCHVLQPLPLGAPIMHITPAHHQLVGGRGMGLVLVGHC